MIGKQCIVTVFYNIIVIFAILSVVSSDLIDSDATTVKIESVVERINVIPTIRVRGTHFEVGYAIGTTYAKLIKDYVKAYTPLESYVKLIHEDVEAKQIYNDCIHVTTQYFPQYVIELQAMALGAGVPFFHLFLIHMNDILTSVMQKPTVNKVDTGCSTILFNTPIVGQYIAHNEDALNITQEQLFIVDAHITPSKSELSGVFYAREEKWSALTYAGSLSGYASGYNHYGVAFSVNTIFAKNLLRNRIPRTFITRALLAAEDNLHDVREILENIGTGTADAFHVSLGFINRKPEDRLLYSIEVTPSKSENKSKVIMKALNHEYLLFYTNKLQYSTKHCEELHEAGWYSSIGRENFYKKLTSRKPVENLKDILRILGGGLPGNRIFRSAHDDNVNTINTSVFDFMNKKWILWTQNPKNFNPLLELHLSTMELKDNKNENYEHPIFKS